MMSSLPSKYIKKAPLFTVFTLVQAITKSHVDYCHSLFTDLPISLLANKTRAISEKFKWMMSVLCQKPPMTSHLKAKVKVLMMSCMVCTVCPPSPYLSDIISYFYPLC